VGAAITLGTNRQLNNKAGSSRAFMSGSTPKKVNSTDFEPRRPSSLMKSAIRKKTKKQGVASRSKIATHP
jgi:hypothetical protein